MATEFVQLTDEELENLPRQAVQIKGYANAIRFHNWFETMASYMQYLKPDIAEVENNLPNGQLLQKLFEKNMNPWDSAQEYLRIEHGFESEEPKEDSFMVKEAPSTLQ